jgi:uncharacterized membrane protein HdeD (DUF308 family)
MKLVGLLMVIAGWLIPVLTLPITHSLTTRLILTVVGLALSLSGILRVLNKAHLKHAIWKA